MVMDWCGLTLSTPMTRATTIDPRRGQALAEPGLGPGQPQPVLEEADVLVEEEVPLPELAVLAADAAEVEVVRPEPARPRTGAGRRPLDRREDEEDAPLEVGFRGPCGSWMEMSRSGMPSVRRDQDAWTLLPTGHGTSRTAAVRTLR